MSGLTPEQRALRKGRLTASECKSLMTGDVEGIMVMWP